MNQKTFGTCTVYLLVGHCLINLLLFARTWYYNPALVLTVIKSTRDSIVFNLYARHYGRGSYPSVYPLSHNFHLRGTSGRRLAEQDLLQAPSSTPMIGDLHPPTFAAIFPGDSLSGGFQLDDFEDETSKDRSENLQTSSSVVDSLPAFVIGFATSVVLCAGYALISEVRDRCKNQECDSNTIITGNRNHQQRMFAREGQSVVAHSLVSGNRSVFLSPVEQNMASSTRSVHYYERGPDGLLYPVILVSSGSNSRSIIWKDAGDIPDQHLYEERSLSPVSTMTSSVAIESARSGHRIMELTECHRVSKDTKLQSLVNLGNISASAITSSSHSHSTVSMGGGSRKDASAIFKIAPKQDDDATLPLEQGLEKVIAVADYDGILAEATSVMGETYQNDNNSISEEDESGWTSSAGKSDSSSDVSIGTYLRSVCSVRSRSSAPSIATSHSSVLFGESLETTPEKIVNQESREDENSMEFSVDDDSLATSQDRTAPSPNDADYRNDQLTGVEGRKETLLPFDSEVVDKNEDDKSLFSSYEVPIKEEPAYVPESIDALSSEQNEGSQSGDEKQNRGAEEDGSEEKSGSGNGPRLDQFLEQNSRILSEAPVEGSIATSKSASFLENSVLSGTESKSSSCIRSVSLVSRSGNSTEYGLGIEVEGAAGPTTNPTVSAVKEGSPASDQVFVGDVILAVNDMDTTGWQTLDAPSDQRSDEAERGTEGLVGQASIKLTLMGMESDGSETGSTSTQDSMHDCATSISLCVGSMEDIEV